MNIEHLKEFIKIVGEESITKAAALLHVAQPTLSKHLNMLENDLGVTLLARGSSGTTATAAGKVLYEDAQRLIIDYDLLIAHAEVLKNHEPSTFVIETYPDYRPLNDAIEIATVKLRETHPGIDLTVEDIGARSALDDLRDGSADLCLTVLPNAIDLNGLTRIPLMSEPLVVVVSNNHPLAARDAINIGDLGNEIVWVHQTPGTKAPSGRIQELLVEHGANPTFVTLPWKRPRSYADTISSYIGGAFVTFKSMLKYAVPPLMMEELSAIDVLDDEFEATVEAVFRDNGRHVCLEVVDLLSDALSKTDIKAYWN